MANSRRKTVSRKAHHRKGYFKPGDFLNWVTGTDVKPSKSRKPKAHNRKSHERSGHFKSGDFLNWVSGGHVHATKVRPPSERKTSRKSRYKKRPNARKTTPKKSLAYSRSRSRRASHTSDGPVGPIRGTSRMTKRSIGDVWDMTGGYLTGKGVNPVRGSIDAVEHAGEGAWNMTGRHVTGRRRGALSYRKHAGKTRSGRGTSDYNKFVKMNYHHARARAHEQGMTKQGSPFKMLSAMWNATGKKVVDMVEFEKKHGKTKMSLAYRLKHSASYYASRSRSRKHTRGKKSNSYKGSTSKKGKKEGSGMVCVCAMVEDAKGKKKGKKK